MAKHQRASSTTPQAAAAAPGMITSFRNWWWPKKTDDSAYGDEHEHREKFSDQYVLHLEDKLNYIDDGSRRLRFRDHGGLLLKFDIDNTRAILDNNGFISRREQLTNVLYTIKRQSI